MNILYTLNDKFVPQVAASIVSICENDQHVSKIHFYLFSMNITAKNKKLIKEMVKKYHQKITIIELNDIKSYFDFDFDTKGWNSIVLARLIIDKILPTSIDKILYLDGDTIIRGDLSELYKSNMGDYVLGASIEPTYSKAHKSAIGLENNLYYNAGVLLINLKKWRKNNIGKKILNFYEKHSGNLFANDQDAINGALKDQIYTISPKYNYNNTFDQYRYNFLKKLVAPAKYIDRSTFNEAKANPVIIHYLGEERPWRRYNTHKYRSDYQKYLALTPYHNVPPEEGWFLYFFCWRIFNFVTKPFNRLRYTIITSLIPIFLDYRSRNLKKQDNNK